MKFAYLVLQDVSNVKMDNVQDVMDHFIWILLENVLNVVPQELMETLSQCNVLIVNMDVTNVNMELVIVYFAKMDFTKQCMTHI